MIFNMKVKKQRRNILFVQYKMYNISRVHNIKKYYLFIVDDKKIIKYTLTFIFNEYLRLL